MGAVGLLAAAGYVLIQSGADQRREEATQSVSERDPQLIWRPSGRDAREQCQNHVRNAAHDPSSVEFIDPIYWPIKLHDDDIWQVDMQLRARNGFGALRAQLYECKVKAIMGGTEAAWSFVSLDTKDN